MATLHCSKCGVSVEAACTCGVPYIPAGEAAIAALKTYPGLSDRAIGKKTRIHYSTIRRARMVEEPTDAFASVEYRKGLDGRTRRMPSSPPLPPPPPPPPPPTVTFVTVEPTETFVPVEPTVPPKVDSVSKPTREEVRAQKRYDKRLAKLDAREKALDEREAQLIEREKRYEELEASFEQTVKTQVWRIQQSQMSALSSNVAPLNEQQFKLLISMCHPDTRQSASEEKLREAYDLLMKYRQRLEFRSPPSISVPPLSELKRSH
jgi:hypothetical protein